MVAARERRGLRVISAPFEMMLMADDVRITGRHEAGP
jgi:hypothetical protein